MRQDTECDRCSKILGVLSYQLSNHSACIVVMWQVFWVWRKIVMRQVFWVWCKIVMRQVFWVWRQIVMRQVALDSTTVEVVGFAGGVPIVYGYDYVGHNCVGRNCVGHSYVGHVCSP